MFTSLTLTIRDAHGNVINGRNSADINDTDIGSLEDGASTVELTIRPTPLDTAYQCSTGTAESHFWEIKWGWTDLSSVSRIGGEIYEITVERMPWG